MLDDKFDYLLRLGDNALVLSQRLTEWVGKGPALEEDMALANTALDLIGQARLWLAYAGEVEGAGRDENRLAFLRDAHDFRNLLLVEQPNGGYADTLVRQYFFDSWHHLLLAELTRSSDPRIAAIAEKAIKEVTYHLRRSADLVVRLGDGTDESARRMRAALERLWPCTNELFDSDAVDRAAAGSGLGPAWDTLREGWLADVDAVLAEAALAVPPASAWRGDGKRGRHSEHLGPLLAVMQVLPRSYPGGVW